MFSSKLKIVKHPSERLRKVSEPIANVTKEIQQIGERMLAFVRSKNGLGLAAPQIGKLIRIIAIDTTGAEAKPDAYKGYMINPVILESKGNFTYLEGCFSLPGIKGWVTRPDNIMVQYINSEGNDILRNFRGITSICIQHEIDHLNGILLIDKSDEIITKAKANEA